ncbi:GIY-YIG nuclease family protein [Streptomyces sp. NPDC088253]|uniref:GIY-YIG nuclease family protein n=1 Tax=Streptomyces sp. NPDC088253 TaxID=3365846 RepID=UPI0038089957
MHGGIATPAEADLRQAILTACNTRRWAKLGYQSLTDWVDKEWDLDMLRPAERKAVGDGLRMVGVSASDIDKVLRVSYEALRRGTWEAEGMTCVYVIGSREFRPVKIGKGDPKKRLGEFQVGNPFPLEVLWATPGGVRLEKALHARFQPEAHRGEWFDFEGRDAVALVAAAVAEIAPQLGCCP